MKTVCVFHECDLDGWMSAAIVKHWFISTNKNYIIGDGESITDKSSIGFPENRIDFIGYNYGQPIPDLSGYDKVIMCDISFPKEVMYNLCERRSDNYPDLDFIYIDHHVSAIDDLEKAIKGSGTYTDYPDGLRDTKFSACELAFNYFYPNQEMPEIIRLLGMYDSFRHKGTTEEKLVLEFQYGARQIITNYEDAFESLSLSLTNQNYVLNILNSGATIYKYLCTEAFQSYKNRFQIRLKEQIDSDGAFIFRNFTCINKERFNPINFGIKYHEDGNDGCACFHYANGKWNFSIYNDNGEVDCSVIAKSFGGGGHRGASGFIVTDINDFFDNTLL